MPSQQSPASQTDMSPSITKSTVEMRSNFLDSMIKRLLNQAKIPDKISTVISEQEIGRLLVATREVLMDQDMLLELETPMKVCGDTHGQFDDLLQLFKRGGFPPTANYLFLGDYVDRGRKGLETISLLFAYKCKYPDNFFLLRGNHECSAINRVYGFYAECKSQYSLRLWQAFQEVFDCLPFCALIRGKIFCMHGGLSPRLKSWNQIRNMKRPVKLQGNKAVSLEMDLLWSDPDQWTVGWAPNPRGASYVFGTGIVVRFCAHMGIDLIIRAHQVVQDGYEFMACRRLITVFSAPNYCGEFDNAAGMINIFDNLQCTFEILHGRGKNDRPPRPKMYSTKQIGHK